jgi:opacity protein-like surface antigen
MRRPAAVRFCTGRISTRLSNYPQITIDDSFVQIRLLSAVALRVRAGIQLGESMNRLRLAFAAAIASACTLVQPAPAADMPSAPPLLRGPSGILTAPWAGWYVGAHLGGAWMDATYTLGGERFTFDPGNFAGGAHLGAQAQWGHWVFGLEGTYTYTGLHESSTTAAAALDVRQIATIAGKFGFAQERWLAYGKAGFAFGRIHAMASPAGSGLTFDSVAWETGYVLGLGVEYQWLPSWVVGLEFDYYGFRFNRSLAGGAISDSNADMFSIMVRLSYLFNSRW